MEEIERMQSKTLKQLLQVPISTSTAGVLMETGIWPAKEYLQYSTMMLYHSIINSEEERITKNIVKEQRKYNLQQTFYSRVHSISKETGVDIKAAEKLRKSAWKKLIKQKIKGNIQKRTGMKWDKKQKQEQLKMINGKGKNTENSAKEI